MAEATNMSEWSDEQFGEAGFDKWQMYQIRKGYKHGLTPEQVATYADPKLDHRQMNQIRWGYENHLTPEQVAICTRENQDAAYALVAEGGAS